MIALLSTLVMAFAFLYSPVSSAGPLKGLPGKDGIPAAVSGNDTSSKPGPTVTAAALDVGSVTDTELVTTTYTYPGTVHRQEMESYSLTVPTSYTLGEFSQYDDGATLALKPFMLVYESIISDFIENIGSEHEYPRGMAVTCSTDVPPTVTGGQDDHGRRYFNLYSSVSKSTPSLYWLVFTGDANDESLNKATLHCGGSSIQVLATAPVLTAAAIVVDSVTDTTLITTTYSRPSIDPRSKKQDVFSLTVPKSVPKSYTLGEFKPVKDGTTLVLQPFAWFLVWVIHSSINPNLNADYEIDYPVGMAIKCPSDVPPTLSTDDDFGKMRYFNLYRSEAASVPALYWLVYTGDVNDSSQNKVTLKCGDQSIPVIAEGNWKD